MFGSVIAGEVIAAILGADPTVGAAVGDRAFGLNVVPPDEALPACVFFLVASGYDDPIGGPVGGERLQMDVKFLCAGASADPILPAAEAAFAALDGLHTGHVRGGVPYDLTFRAVGEAALSPIDEGRIYAQLGTTYAISVTRGG